MWPSAPLTPSLSMVSALSAPSLANCVSTPPQPACLVMPTKPYLSGLITAVFPPITAALRITSTQSTDPAMPVQLSASNVHPSLTARIVRKITICTVLAVWHNALTPRMRIILRGCAMTAHRWGARLVSLRAMRRSVLLVRLISICMRGLAMRSVLMTRTR